MISDTAALAERAIEAINSRDPDRIRPLLAGDVAITTGRAVHRGPDAVLAWARKEYDHLARRYAPDEIRCDGERALALGSVQYVWSEVGEVADSSPIALELEFSSGLLRSLQLHDDTAAALLAFEE